MCEYSYPVVSSATVPSLLLCYNDNITLTIIAGNDLLNFSSRIVLFAIGGFKQSAGKMPQFIFL